MSDITLRIKGDFSQARKAFEELAESSEETREQMEKYAESLTASELEEFNRAQRRIQDSMRGTRGETAALEQSSRNYQRQIEKLIRQGFDPNSTAVRELTREQQRLQEEVDKSRKAKERKTKAMKAAKTALKASAVAVAGVVTGVIALTKRNANLANSLANSARVVGLTTEAYQELDYVMRMSGVENGDYMLNRLNRSVIDVRNETGTLTKFLENNYAQLLEQLQGVENNEEAFTLLMDAINRAPNEFAAAELAMAAFGRNGAHMVLVAQNGTEGINALRDEARELGVVSHANAQAAIAFNDAMFRLRTSVQNMTQELTSQLLPALTNVVARVTNAIQRAGEFRARLEDLRGVVTTLVPIIAGLGAGMATFIGTMKAVGYITTLINKLRALQAVMTGKKITTMAAAAAHKMYVYAKSLGKAAIPAILAAGTALVVTFRTIRNNLRDAANEAMEINKEFEEFEFPDFNFIAGSIDDLNVALTELAWGGARAVVEAMDEDEVADAAEKAAVTMYDYLKVRLRETSYMERHAADEQLGIIRDFLRERMRYLSDDWDERYEFLKEQFYLIRENHLISADERYLIERELHRKLKELDRERVESARQTAKNMMIAYSTFFGGLSKLLGVAGKENRAFFIASRSMALVQAGINTALAVTKALASMPPPMSFVKAIGVGIKGAAQKAKIASSMIPSAETGGRFVVPQSRGVDNSIMRVNPGETVEVTPRGMTGTGGVSQYIFKINEQTIFDIVNRGGRSGDIYEFEPTRNM